MALYAASAYAERRGIRLAALGVGLLGAALAGLEWGYEGRETVTIAALTATMVAFFWTLGDSMRTRRAYVGQLEERARRLEFERDQQARLARGAERTRIAREVHDVIAHSLSIVIAQADGGMYAARQDPGAATRALETIAATGRHALAETRRLLNVLRTEEPSAGFDDLAASMHETGSAPPADGHGHGQEVTSSASGRPSGTADGADRTGGRPRPETEAEKDWVPQPDLSGIDDLIDRFRTAGLPVELAVHGSPPHTSAGFQLAAYRIVQEALTNTFKHGGPGVRAEVTLQHGAGETPDGRPSAPSGRNPHALRIHVTDDGHGAAASRSSATTGGHGIVGMRERASLYGGTLRAGPRAGGGFEVVAELPYVS